MTGRFVDPAPRHALLARLRIVPPAMIASGHLHQYRESWSDERATRGRSRRATSSPDRRQPLHGLKQVGYVEHRLEPDGTKAGWCTCPAWRP
jgi:Icc protein